MTPPAVLLGVFKRRPEGWIFLLALAVRLGALFRFTASPHFGVQGGDSEFYQAWALRILHGVWSDGHAFYGLPGYAFLLAGFYAVCGVEPFVPIAVQALVEAATAVLCFGWTRRLVIAEPSIPADSHLPLAAGVLASVGWLLFLPAQAYALILMPTVWVVAGYWAVLWALSRGEARHPLWRWGALGGVIGLLAMMVATILLLLPLGLGALLLRRTAPLRRRGLVGAVFLGGLFAGCAPAWMHNCFFAHEPVLLSAHGGLNFWLGNQPEANGYPKIPAELRSGQQELLDDSIRLAEQAAGHALTRPEVSRYWSERAWAAIRLDPVRWLTLLGRKVHAFWSSYSYDDLTIIPLLRLEGALWPGFGFGLLSVLGGAGLLLGVSHNRAARWAAAGVLLQLLALLPVFVTERYRMVAAAGLVMLGSYGLSRLYLAWRERTWVAPGALLGCGALWFFVPAPVAPSAGSMEPYNLAIAEMEVAQRLEPAEAAARERQLARAASHLHTAETLAPENARIAFAWGRYWTARTAPAEAAQAYRRALQLDPKFTDAQMNLAVLEMADRHWAEAAELLEAATAGAPRDASAFYLLARARLELGQPEAARRALARAVELSPLEQNIQALRQKLYPGDAP